MMCRFPRRLSYSALIVGAIFGFLGFSVINKLYFVSEAEFMDTYTFTDGFDNATGVDHFIVPNIIHFIRFKNFELKFMDYVVVLAAMRNHRPDKFYFHTDIKDAKCEGKYWEWVKKDQDLWSRIEIKYLEVPTEIFGQQLSDGWRLWHGSDISRIRIIKKYGGIYLDNDCFVLKSLDKYRKFECTVNWDEDKILGNQVIIANKNARILPLWLDTYKVYRSDEWYYNGGERPTVEILHPRPEIIHRTKGEFGTDDGLSTNLYLNPDFAWRHLDMIHLLIGQRIFWDPNYNATPVFKLRTVENGDAKSLSGCLDINTGERWKIRYLMRRKDKATHVLIRSSLRYKSEQEFMDTYAFFDNFNNATGVDHFIVPNIIHFIRFKNFQLGFVDYVVLKAAMRNHRPDKFYYHTDVKDAKCEGKYWEWVKKDEALWSRIEVKYVELPTQVFGQKLSEGWGLFHGSDITRLRILQKYGGIYLDNDCYVIQSLDKYRKFECTVNWDENQFLGNQVIIANKNARVLPLWLDTYKEYHSDRWYYNGGERPTVEVLYRHPELVHRVKGNFGADTGVSVGVYKNPQMDWRRLDIIHLLMGHRSYMDPNFNKTPVFDENIIRTYPYPFGEMAREVLDLPPPPSK